MGISRIWVSAVKTPTPVRKDMQQFKKTTSPNKIILRASPLSQTSLFPGLCSGGTGMDTRQEKLCLYVKMGLQLPFHLVQKSWRLPPEGGQRKQHSQELLMPYREKNEAIRVMFEAETQLTGADTSQWEGGCWHVLLRPSARARVQLQLSWPAKRSYLCCTSAFASKPRTSKPSPWF